MSISKELMKKVDSILYLFIRNGNAITSEIENDTHEASATPKKIFGGLQKSLESRKYAASQYLTKP